LGDEVPDNIENRFTQLKNQMLEGKIQVPERYQEEPNAVMTIIDGVDRNEE
jgi:hypothetical protein